MKRTPEAQHDALRQQWKNTKAFHDLCTTLQLAFVIPSDELLAIDYLKLKSNPSSIGYHVPPKVLEQSRLLLRPGTYQEIVEERAALKLCGYPCCCKQLASVPDQKKVYFRLNLSKKQISEERDSNFCGTECHKKSLQFERSLDDVAIKYNSHSVEELKTALQIIMGWYKCKLFGILPASNCNTNSNTNPVSSSNLMESRDPVPSIPNQQKSKTNGSSNGSNPLHKMVGNLDLKIVEKNVALNLHQTVTVSNTAPKKKWKRPSVSKSKSNRKRTSNQNNSKSKVMKMDVDDANTMMKAMTITESNTTTKTTKTTNHQKVDEPLTMTEMEQLFRTAKREKQRMERQNSSKWSKDDGDDMDCEMEEVYENTNGRKVKVSQDLSAEEIEKMEREKMKLQHEERKRTEYAAMSANAQLMGQYISWCTDATTDFVTKREAAYLKWKEIAMKHYDSMFCAPQMLRERQGMLINNMMKYVNGLLAKFEVKSILHPLIEREIRLLVETFDIKEGIPSFTAKTWCFIAFVVLKLVSYRIDDLKREMFGKQERVQKVLATIGFGQEYVTTFEEIVVFD